MRGILPVVSALILFGLSGSPGAQPPPAPPRTPADPIADLAGGDEAARFDAILHLADSRDPGVGKLLEEARGSERFRQPGIGRAALEFVLVERGKSSAGRSRTTPGEGMNIILVSLDTLRADRLGCYGYHRRTSPSIDGVAARGAVFSRAISPSSWTLPVHMSILTSRYPSFHGVDRSGVRWNARLSASERTMAEYLKGAGFATAAFVGNAFLDAQWGFGRGFDLYRRSEIDAENQSRKAALWLRWHAYRADRGLAARNFFLFLHYNDAHLPYTAPEEFRRKFAAEKSASNGDPPPVQPCVPHRARRISSDLENKQALYDAEINYLDTHLGRFLKSLEDLGLAPSTLLILTSDHGEEFGDHGGINHKLTLYEEVIRVPLILAYPRLIAPGQRIDASVSLLDILPTVLEAVGQSPPARSQGISLLPYLRRSGAGAPVAPPRTRQLFAELGPLGVKWDMPVHSRVVSTSDHKLVATYVRDGRVTKEFYDLVADPRERCNLYDDRRETPVLRELEERLEAFIREGLAARGTQEIEEGFALDEELVEQLRSLGYIN